MPVHPGPNAAYPSDYPAPKKMVLVLSCIDNRLLDDLVRFLDHDNLTNRYYHLTFAGTALCLTDEHKNVFPKGPDPDRTPNFQHWQTTFREQFAATVLLSKGTITDVYIVQHADCGAFFAYFKADYSGHETLNPVSRTVHNPAEEKDHEQIATAMADYIYNNFCIHLNPQEKPPKKKLIQPARPNVHTFFMDLRGNVRRMYSVPGLGIKPQVC